MTNTQTALMDGTRVYFTSLTGLIDSSVAGTVTDAYPVDPGTGRPNREFAWVRWDDGTHELDSIDNLVTVASTKELIMMDQDQQRDYSEEQYLRHLCPECDQSPCIGEACTGEPAKPERAADGWLESLRSIRAVLDSVRTENEKDPS